MWREKNRALFLDCLGELEKDPFVCQLQQYHQHTAATTRYGHCVCVAYLSFTMCRWMGLDYTAAARGGLLHDLYLSQWEGSDDGALSRWRTHPQAALENARRFPLSAKEEDIIVKHMFPVTLALPRYCESYIVSIADKLAAVLEKTHLARPLGIHRNLRALVGAS
ncbi:MAG: HDIG domain-containing protein [Oscillospiraceae bacterium]|nr:HDIG domain-containing protein [Oscillospiraceae bacterium]